MKPAQAGTACLLDGSRVNTGFFFEVRDTSLEDAQHLEYWVKALIAPVKSSVHLIEPPVVLRLHGVQALIKSLGRRPISSYGKSG